MKNSTDTNIFFRQALVATIIQHNEYVYFSIKNGVGFYRINLATGIIEKLADFSFAGQKRTDLYRFAFMCHEKIYFVPNNAKDVAVFEINSGEMKYDSSYNEMVAFLSTVDMTQAVYNTQTFDGIVYVIGIWSNPFIYKMDIAKKKGERLSEIERTLDLGHTRLSLDNCCWENGNCYISEYDMAKIYKIDFASNSADIIYENKEINNIHGMICEDSNCYILSDNGKSLYSVDLITRQYIQICEYSRNLKAMNMYSAITKISDKIYFIPDSETNADMIIFDCTRKEIVNTLIQNIGNISWINRWRNKLIVYACDQNLIRMLDGIQCIREYPIKDEETNIVSYYLGRKMDETGVWTLEEFLRDI